MSPESSGIKFDTKSLSIQNIVIQKCLSKSISEEKCFSIEQSMDLKVISRRLDLQVNPPTITLTYRLPEQLEFL